MRSFSPDRSTRGVTFSECCIHAANNAAETSSVIKSELAKHKPIPCQTILSSHLLQCGRRRLGRAGRRLALSRRPPTLLLLSPFRSVRSVCVVYRRFREYDGLLRDGSNGPWSSFALRLARSQETARVPKTWPDDESAGRGTVANRKGRQYWPFVSKVQLASRSAHWRQLKMERT
jgi:hypothetical protein